MEKRIVQDYEKNVPFGKSLHIHSVENQLVHKDVDAEVQQDLKRVGSLGGLQEQNQ